MVKRILKKILLIILIVLILNNFFMTKVMAAEPLDTVVGVIEGILGGIVGILSFPFRFVAIIIGDAVNGLTAIIAYTEKPTDTGIDTGTLTPFDILFNKVPILDINFFEIGDEENIVNQIRTGVATWYYVLRILASAILLVILVYVGIRMAISTVASDRAMYKKMLVDWVCSLALIFVIQYIIVFTININNALVNAMSVTSDSEEISNAFDVIKSEAMKVFSLDAVGATVVYCMLVWQTIGLLISYFNRMLKIAFLIIISPLITLTYSIDKMGDGKAQALGKWLKEFVFTILMQPFHCIIYMSLINIAMKMLIDNTGFGGTGSIRDSLATALVAILCIRFVKEAEKIVRKIFAFQDDNSGTSLVAGMAASAVVLSNAKKFGRGTRSAVTNISNLGKNGLAMVRAANIERKAVWAMIRNKDGEGKSFAERKEDVRTELNTKKAKKINQKLDKKNEEKLKQAQGNIKEVANAVANKRPSEDDVNERKKDIIARNGGNISEEEAESQARLELAKERRTDSGPVRSRIHKARGEAFKAMKIINSSEVLKELADRAKSVATGGAALMVGSGVYGTQGNIATAISAGAAIHGGMKEFMKNSSKTILKDCRENLENMGVDVNNSQKLDAALKEIFDNKDKYGDMQSEKAKEAMDKILNNLNLDEDSKKKFSKIKSVLTNTPDAASSKIPDILKELKHVDGTEVTERDGKELLDFSNKHAIVTRVQNSSDIISEESVIKSIENYYATTSRYDQKAEKSEIVLSETQSSYEDTAAPIIIEDDITSSQTESDYQRIADNILEKMKENMDESKVQGLENVKKQIMRACIKEQEDLDIVSIEFAKECSKKLEEEAKKLQEGSKEKKQIETMIINLNNNITLFEDKSQE